MAEGRAATGVMTVRAYLLIDTNRGQAWRIAELLRNTPGVTLVDVTTGPHEVIAVFEATDAIASGAVQDIRATQGVRYVTTCFAIRAQS